MFRAANNASKRVILQAGARLVSPTGQLAARAQGTAPMKKKGVSAAAVGAGAVTLTLAGTLGYAWWEPTFRDTLETTVPYADSFLDAVLGSKNQLPPRMPDVPSRMRVVKSAVDQSSQKTAAKATTDSESKTESAVPVVNVQEEPKLSALPPADSKPEESSSKAEADLVAERARALETDAVVENLALEQLLKQLSEQAQTALDAAVDAQQRAAVAVVGHVERVFRSQNDSSEVDWSKVKDSASVKAELCQKADQLAREAREYLDKLSAVLEESRLNKITAENDELLPVQESLSNAYYRLDTAKNKVSAALSEARVMDEFCQLVEAARTKFQQEMSSIVPGIVLGENNSKLSAEELNVLLVYAYRKVLYLQKELARMTTVEQQKFSSALEKQRRELDVLLDDRLSSELSRQQRHSELYHRQQLAALQTELENEMRQQLRRQTGAHSDHLQDVLAVQEREVRRRIEAEHDNRLRAEQSKFQAELAGIMGELKGVKDTITARADLDRAAHRAQQMWAACQGLKRAIRTGQLAAQSWEDQLRPLSQEVAAIKQAAGESSPFVEAVLASMPDEALQRGVFTEDSLRERFFKVERLCKRVSMIDDDGGSLLKYALSYLQSLLVVDAFERLPSKEQRDQPISTDLSTYDVIARARYCIDKDDLVQAVKYMGLLRGEARQVAADWVRETRLLLEARLVADALLAHAAATGLQAL